MTVDEFVNRCSYVKDKDALQKFISERLKTRYVPFDIKCKVCHDIVYKSNKQGDEYVQDSQKGYALYLLSLINSYTDVVVGFADASFSDEYDKLKRNGYLESLINIIPESELKEFSILIEFANADFIDNVKR